MHGGTNMCIAWIIRKHGLRGKRLVVPKAYTYRQDPFLQLGAGVPTFFCERKKGQVSLGEVRSVVTEKY